MIVVVFRKGFPFPRKKKDQLKKLVAEQAKFLKHEGFKLNAAIVFGGSDPEHAGAWGRCYEKNYWLYDWSGCLYNWRISDTINTTIARKVPKPRRYIEVYNSAIKCNDDIKSMAIIVFHELAHALDVCDKRTARQREKDAREWAKGMTKAFLD